MSNRTPSLFPALEDGKHILLYSIETRRGRFEIFTTKDAFTIRIPPHQQKIDAYLAFDGVTIRKFSEVGDATRSIKRPAKCGYLSKWRREVPNSVVSEFINSWIKCHPDGSIRGLVDYFAHDATRLVSRTTIYKFLKQGISHGTLSRLPSDDWIPSEFRPLVRLAERREIPIGRPKPGGLD